MEKAVITATMTPAAGTVPQYPTFWTNRNIWGIRFWACLLYTSFPAVFVFGLEPGQGPGLIFGTLPKVFESMIGGPIFAIAFFILVFFAALTSAIALLEVVAASAIDTLGWTRKKSVLVLGICIFILGIPSALSFGVLGDVTILNYSVLDVYKRQVI